jgi:hypothetical protein
MEKQQIIQNILEKHQLFLAYIDSLSKEEFEFNMAEKWNAGQQLEHIILSIKAISKAFGMEKTELEQNFGLSENENRSYNVLTTMYQEKTSKGAIAPDRFVPKNGIENSKIELLNALQSNVDNLCLKIDNFTEKELDTLCLPHPLLGKLTLREMLFNVIYHVQHHEALIKKQLTNHNNFN